jgi:hypothetical protein
MRKTMDRNCQHCGELIVGKAYRVTSEEEGISLLDMIVCSLCFMEAKRLRLHAEAINVRKQRSFSSKPRESPSATRNLVAAFVLSGHRTTTRQPRSFYKKQGIYTRRQPPSIFSSN